MLRHRLQELTAHVVNRERTVSSHDVRHQPLVARRVLPAQHHRRFDLVTGQERRLDLAQLDAEAAQLDLVVAATEELDDAAGRPSRQVAAAVHPAAPRPLLCAERIGQELLGGEGGVVEVTPRHAVAAGVELAWYSDRNRL